MRVRFELPEKNLVDKFREIKIGEFFGVSGERQMYTGVKTRENEALVYNEDPELTPVIWKLSPSENVIAYNTVITLREDGDIKNESKF